MTGKDKCEFLREIRKNMAEANGIPYEPRECNYEGDCSGRCPFCEKEAADLLATLKEKEAQGVEIKTDVFSTTLLEKGKLDFDDAYEAFASELERREEMLKPVGRIRCDEKEAELRRRQEEELEQEKERIMKEINRPLMGDIDYSYYHNLMMEKTKPQKTVGIIGNFRKLIDMFFNSVLPGKISFKNISDENTDGLTEENEQGKG